MQATLTKSQKSSKYVQSLVKIKQKLKQSLQLSKPLHLTLRRACSLLAYFVKMSKYNQIQKEVGQQLLGCMKIVKLLGKVMNYQKFGVFYGFLLTLLRNYEDFMNKKIQIKQEDIYKNIQTFENSQYRTTLQLLPISTTDLAYINSQNTNVFFQKLKDDKIKLHNYQCLNCTNVFIKNQPIYNLNPFWKTVGMLTQNKLAEQVVLKMYINGICNAGGGLLIIGVEKREGLYFPTGIKFNIQQEIIQAQNQIVTAIKSTRPDCFYQIYRVPVIGAECEKFLELEYSSVCFKVILLPSYLKKISYVEYSPKGYQKVCDVYSLDKKGELKKIELNRDFYVMVQQRYRKNDIKLVNSHEGVKCINPLSYIHSKNIEKFYEEKDNPQPSFNKIEDAPKLIYQNITLLSVNTKKDNRHIQFFGKILIAHKQMVNLQQPFRNSFKNCSRQIWIISHQAKSKQIKEYLSTCYNDNLLPEGALTLIPVHKNLQIDRQKLSQHNEQIFSNKFKLRYSEGYRTETAVVPDKDKKQKTILYLIFSDYSQAIYAYMLFEELNLRPFFVQQLLSLMKNKSKVKVQSG